VGGYIVVSSMGDWVQVFVKCVLVGGWIHIRIVFKNHAKGQ